MEMLALSPVWEATLNRAFHRNGVKPKNEVKCRICGGWVKTTVLFLGVCRPKFVKFWATMRPCVVSNAVPALSI